MDFPRRSRRRGLAPSLLVAIASLAGGCADAPGESLAQVEQPQRRTLLFGKSETPLLPKDSRANDEFGTAIAVSQRWAAVGSPRDDFDDADINDETGSVKIFERSNANVWEEITTLWPPRAWPDAQFGKAIAMTDDVVAVGALEADPSADGSKWGVGSVATFAYVKNSWRFESFLHDPHEDAERLFGGALAMDDRTLLVGAYGGDQVFAFTRTASGWSQPVTLDSPAPNPHGTGFGFAVALREPYAFVGAPHDDGDGNAESRDSGAIYVFKHDEKGWTPHGQLERSTYSPLELFGFAVAVKDGLVVGTAYGDTSATTFRLDSSGRWQNPFRMVPGETTTASAFGRSVAIGSGDSIWVGASRDRDYDGSVFPFLPDDKTWLEAPNISFTDEGRFGYAVASVSGALLVGAPFAGDDYQGAVYVIETSNGSQCSSDADCYSAHCVSGVCCNTSCTSPCHSCLGSENAAGSKDGSCEPKRAGMSDEACPDEGARSCGHNGLCDGTGSCSRYSAGTQCSEPFCSGTDLVGAALCDGVGECVPPAAGACRAYACSEGACLDECSASSDCSDDSYCSEGRCYPLLGLGAACSIANACSSGHCADGVCCNTACDGMCEACAEVGTEGVCAALGAGAPPRASFSPKLQAAGVCDRLFCDGIRRDVPALLAGTNVICAAAGCTDGGEVGAARCDGAGQCVPPPLKDCGTYACRASDSDSSRPGQCLTRCTSVDDCAADSYCTTDHECRPIEAAGSVSHGCTLGGRGAEDDWSCLLAAVSLAVFRLRRGRPTHRQGTHAT
jgi:hypothetical protein